MIARVSQTLAAAGLATGVLLVASCGKDTPSDPGPKASAITIVSGNNQQASVGSTFGQPLVVKVTDAAGDAMSNVTVAFQVTSGAGSVNPASATTDATGLAQANITAGGTAGALTIKVSGGGINVTAVATVTATVQPGQLTGRWVGTNSQNRNVTLWVGQGGVMDSLRIAINVTILSGFSSCTITFTTTNITIGSGGAFTAALASPTLATGTVAGSFSSTLASGTFQAGWDGTIICGSSITFGTGGNSATGTWQATRSPLGVTSVTPDDGPLAGGTNVSIVGWFEAAVDSVRLGSARLTNVVRVSNTMVTGTTPAATTSGNTLVTVYSGSTSATCSGCFSYNATPTVTDVSPNSGSVYGGGTLTVNGTAFPTTIDSVRLGSERVGSVARSSSTRLTGVAPASASPGPVNLVVYSTSAGNATCAGCYTYTAPGPITVNNLSPTNGPLGGGATVTINGSDFPPVIDSVRIGAAKLGSLVRVSGTRITGTTPAGGAPGAVNVTVYSGASNGGCTSCYTYNAPITVASLAPASGRLAGGTSVAITGANFPTTIDSVRIGSARLTSVVRSSSTRITGTTPAGSVLGPVDITVFTTSAGSGTCVGCYTYTWTVALVTPASGPVAGGSNVSITTTDLPATIDSVLLGSARMTNVVRVSTTELTGVTPAGSAGPTNITVFAAGSGSATCTGCFTYNPPMTVNAVSPSTGSTDGKLPVTITGTNFPATIDSVLLGNVRLTSVVRVSATQITAATPAGALGAVNVAVFSTLAASGNCAGCFTYTTPVTWARVVPGGTHTCGLTNAGATYCWGDNLFGQVGDSSTTDRTAPVPLKSGTAFASLMLGGSHTCGLTGTSVPWCWGQGSSGQLGLGAFSSRTAPVAVTGGLTFAGMTAGNSHTCGVTGAGQAYCWGDNFDGQVGNGATLDRVSPTAVSGAIVFANLSGGGTHTCGLTSGGVAYCWGANASGQLGDGGTTARTTPGLVSGGLTFASLLAGASHTCGLTSAGAAYCWGLGTSGRLGDGASVNRSAPVPVMGGLTFASLAVGGSHTCGLTSAGAAYCWGSNTSGQLGDGTTTLRLTPVPVSGGLAFARLTAGGSHACGVTSSGAAWCWGSNNSGRLGDGTLTNRSSPVAVVSP